MAKKPKTSETSIKAVKPLSVSLEALNKHRLNDVPIKKIHLVLLVNAHKKDDIIKELAAFDLHQASIYPEIDRVADFIKSSY